LGVISRIYPAIKGRIADTKTAKVWRTAKYLPRILLGITFTNQLFIANPIKEFNVYAINRIANKNPTCINLGIINGIKMVETNSGKVSPVTGGIAY